jgi:hypothetical protein
LEKASGLKSGVIDGTKGKNNYPVKIIETYKYVLADKKAKITI